MPPCPDGGGAFAAVAAAAGWYKVWLYRHSAMQAGNDVIERVGGLAAISAAVLPRLKDASPKPLLVKSLRDK